ncbi:hypothetical protein C8T65DRAFT_588176, partial [Cerioporus squamosus]
TIHTILDSRKLGQRYEYLVRWKDSSADEDCWIPLSDIPTTHTELVERYHRRHPRSLAPPPSILHHSAHAAFESTDNHSVSTSLQASPSSSEPAPAAPNTAPAPARPARTAHAAVPPAAPRHRSPAPVRINPRVEYAPPSQTTLRSGCVSRPPPRPDA